MTIYLVASRMRLLPWLALGPNRAIRKPYSLVRSCRLVLLAPRAPLPTFDLGTLLTLEIDLIGCGAPEADDYETALALLAFRDVATE
ncbi:hypothetical protein CNY89_14870 [Amaricoccus sp. HAR-UPW-R2A-40]|nr:hypothetical protein CNY89_14870 [Amaricoccus sp. HAR-UPW-R2A-40]